MDIKTIDLSPKDRLITSLFESINSIAELKNDLNILDIDEASKALKKLQSLVKDKQKEKARVFETHC